jgi:hypothetical protein
MVAVLVIVQLLVIAVAVGGARDQSALVARVQTTAAFYAAEGAMNMAIREVVELADDDNDGVAGGIATGASAGQMPAFSPGARASVGRDDTGSETTLTATGVCGDSRRRVRVTLAEGSRAGRRVIYSQWPKQVPQYRIWSGAAWGPAAGTLDFEGQQYWMLIRRCPIRDELIEVCSIQTDRLRAAVESGGTWGNPILLTGDVGTVSTRPFSLAYEQVSGRALVAYRTGSSATIRYRFWDGTSWSGESSASSPLTGQPAYMRLVPRAGSNEMVLYVLDSNREIAAMVWDGSSFGNATVLETNAASSSAECVDAAYERGTGRCMVAWSQQGATAPRYAFWTGSAWTATSVAPDLGGSALWIHLASDPASNRLLAGFLDGGSRIHVNLWSGSAWDAYVRVTAAAPTTGSRCFDVAFEPQGTRGLVVYGHAGSPLPRFNVHNGTSWGLQQNGPMLPNPPLLVQLTPSGGGREIMCLMNVTGGQNMLEFLRWNGGALVNRQQLEPNVSGPSGAEVFMIPDEPPVTVPLRISTWAETAP